MTHLKVLATASEAFFTWWWVAKEVLQTTPYLEVGANRFMNYTVCSNTLSMRLTLFSEALRVLSAVKEREIISTYSLAVICPA